MLPRSKYLRLVQLFISLGTGPESELNPRDSFSRDVRSQRKGNGKFPDKPRRERSISVTERLELQVTPAKEHGLEVGFHESKTLGFESRREDLILSRTWRSSEETMESRERTRRRKKNPKLRDVGDMLVGERGEGDGG